MNVTDKIVLAGGTAGSGGVLWGMSSGELHGYLEYASGAVALVCFLIYGILLLRRLRMTNKVGNAKLDAAKAEADFWRGNFKSNKPNPGENV